MNSSRGWGDNLDQTSASRDPDLQRRYLRGLIVVVTLAVVVVGVWGGWRFVRSRCEPLLAEARVLLGDALQQERNARYEQLQHAELLVRDYLARGGKRKDTAELLLCSVLILRGYGDPDQPTAEELEIEDLLNRIKPDACSMDDLLTAIDIFIRTGQIPKADWLIDAALKLGEGTADRQRILRMAADIRYDVGREKAVLEHCQELATIDPLDPEPWRLIAWVHEDGGYDERMIEALKRVIELDQSDAAEERLKLTDSLIRVGQLREAQDQFAQLRAVSPGLLSKHPLMEAKLLILEGKTQEAMPIIDRVLDADPQESEAMLLRGKILLSKSQLDEAVAIMEELLKIEPMQSEAHYVLGQALARRSETDLATEHLQMHKRILDTRVKIHGLERRAGRNPRDAEVRAELVRLYERLGMTEHAEFWRRAAETAQHGGGE